jgi:hypothetical protein
MSSRTFAKQPLVKGMTLVRRNDEPESIRVRLPGVGSKEFSIAAHGKAGAVIAAKKHIDKMLKTGKVQFKEAKGSIYKHNDGRRFVAKLREHSASFAIAKHGGVRKARAAAEAWLAQL